MVKISDNYGIDTGLNTTTGNVGIGTTSPSGLLDVGGGTMVVTDTGVAVNGRIDCDSIYVNSTGLNVPDYVFEDGYQIKSMEDAIHYIKTHKHLPGLPDASNIAEWSQIDLQVRDMKVLEKIEEQMIYIMQQHKRIKELEEQVKDIKFLKKEVSELKTKNWR